MKRILVDMSCTLLHHGHIRLLAKASKLGDVIVALTTDEEIETNKGFKPELNFKERKEILMSINYVKKVIPSKWLIDDNFILKNKIDMLVHGNDNSNNIKTCELVIFPRTIGVSSSDLRNKAYEIVLKKRSD